MHVRIPALAALTCAALACLAATAWLTYRLGYLEGCDYAAIPPATPTVMRRPVSIR